MINQREKIGLKHFSDAKAFAEYSNDMQDVYKNIEESDMINNKKLNPVVTEFFIRGRKLSISIVFITQSYFKVPNNVRLNSTHFSL